jgi:Domain of unknown function (DUF4062)
MADDVSAGPRKIFISSTYEDLRRYVHAAEAVVSSHCFEAEHFKHWAATGRPSVSECKERVQACKALIVIGSAYGWVPPVDQGGDGFSSITRLEVQWAREKPITVMPFFVRGRKAKSSHASRPDMRLEEFAAESRKDLCQDVSSVETFREALGRSLLELEEKLRLIDPPAVVGEPRQGTYAVFRDRVDARSVLESALDSNAIRAAFIVGKGGFGKSALANYAIEGLRRSGQVDTVIFLNPARDLQFDGFDLFMWSVARTQSLWLQFGHVLTLAGIARRFGQASNWCAIRNESETATTSPAATAVCALLIT